jgi:hypothetical protein
MIDHELLLLRQMSRSAIERMAGVTLSNEAYKRFLELAKDFEVGDLSQKQWQEMVDEALTS